METEIDFLKLIVCTLRNIMLNGKMIMNSVRRRLWKKVVMVCFRILSHNLCGLTEEDHEKPHSG
jgi:hypothetical protein